MSEVKVKREFIYNRESFLSSLAADAVTFGFLIGLMFLNFLYWGGRWYVTVFIMFIWLLSTLAKGSKRVHKFHSIDECIAYLEKEKLNERN